MEALNIFHKGIRLSFSLPILDVDLLALGLIVKLISSNRLDLRKELLFETILLFGYLFEHALHLEIGMTSLFLLFLGFLSVELKIACFLFFFFSIFFWLLSLHIHIGGSKSHWFVLYSTTVNC